MIPVKNIYYMLSYAFQALKTFEIKNTDVESFDNVQKLCAEILINGMNHQIKRGLNQEYIETEESLSSVRGKINISESIKSQDLYKRKLICTYDTYTVNNKLNQIIKSTLKVLMRADILTEQKKKIRTILNLLAEVNEIDLFNVDWNMNYNRGNQSYRFMIVICYFVVKGLIQTQTSGSTRIMNVFDEQRMSRLYEKFILEYYKKHHSDLRPSASYIDWQLDKEGDEMLPAMKSDVMLRKENKILIIDAKYYSHNTQSQFDKNTIHSGNLYQLFAYVKNKEYELKDVEHEVSGMLLYAKTDEEIQPDSVYSMSGNSIAVRTLDLNQPFISLAGQLETIVKEYFS